MSRPNPYDEAEKRRTELKADVALMRELGVARWGEIVLAPPPGAALKEITPEELQARIAAQAQAKQDILFAASGTRPRVVMPPVGRRGGG